MPEFRPFLGIRYDGGVAGRLDDLVAPPYDVLGEGEVRSLYAKSPYNVIRIDYGILGEEPGSEARAETSWHEAAGRLYRKWRADGVLRQEKAPAFYLLRQSYRVPGGGMKQVTGLFGACRLSPFAAGEVLPHEHTFAKPKEDRLRLMQATNANLSPIYAFYSDPELKLDRILAEVQAGAPDASAVDGEGERHELWVVSDPQLVAEISKSLADRPFYIADGHHRYETALAYRNERKEAGAAGGGWEYVMMFVANMDADGMTILPTHRLVKAASLPDVKGFAEAVSAWYDVVEEELGPEEGLARARATVSEATGRIGCYVGGGRWWWLTPKDREGLALAIPGERSRAVKELAVTALHELVLPAGLGIDRAAQSAGGQIDYLRDADRGMERVDAGEAVALFYVPAPRPADVKAVADAGDVMPHKSTYFYPKLLTGLVLFDLAEPL